tara:strand:+ start:8855 stop:9274 length:420 start_codon:yes stop_codon:yes gene_type:complete
LTAKQTFINRSIFFGFPNFCKFLQLLLSQNRVQSRQSVVFCDRVTWARIAGGRTAITHVWPTTTPAPSTSTTLPAHLFSRTLCLCTTLLLTPTTHSPPTQLLTIHDLQSKPHQNIMPKEKVTRGKGKATKADGGKKKKG